MRKLPQLVPVLSLADWVSIFRAFIALAATLLTGLGFWPWWWLVWAVIGLSDKLDGILARRFGSSPHGATIDEKSDKICIILGFLSCITLGLATWPLFILILVMVGRDIWVTLIRRQMSKRGNNSIKSAKTLGKVKTVFQYTVIVVAMMPAHMLGPISGTNMQPAAVTTLALAATAFSLISGWQYFRIAFSKTTKEGS